MTRVNAWVRVGKYRASTLKQPHRADFRAPQPEEVLDQRRFTGSVLANEAEDGTSRYAQRHVVQRLLGAEASRQVTDGDHCLGAG